MTNDGKCGTPKTSEGETKFTADKFPNGFPRPDKILHVVAFHLP